MHEQVVELGARAEQRAELSQLQREVWTSQRLHPESPLANMATLHRVAGSVDPERFAAAFDRVVQASDALRMVIVDDRSHPFVRVLARPPGRTEVVDLDIADLGSWVADRVSLPIDITVCGYDSVLLRHGADDWTWWLDLHHAVTDATSQAIVFEEVARQYDDPSVEVDIAPFVTHHEFVESVGDHPIASTETGARATPLRPLGVRGPTTTASPMVPIDLAVEPASLADRARTAFPSISPDLSVLALLVSGMALATHRTDGRRDVVVGVPVHQRHGRASKRVVGPLLELHPVDVAISPDDTAASLVARTLTSIIAMLSAARKGPPPRRDFELVVNVVRVPVAQLGGMDVSVQWIRAPHVDPAHSLRLHAADHGRGLELELDVNAALATGDAATRLSHHVGNAIGALLADPEGSVAAIGVATGQDLADVADLTPPSPPSTKLRPVHLAVRDALRADPHRIVAEQGDRLLDAASFDRLVGKAQGWLQSCGVVDGDRVGLRMERSIDVLVAIHAVLRSGAAFVMLDPGDPASRHEAIRDDAALRLIVDDLVSSEGFEPVETDSPGDLDATAYVLYTSGSTGLPKGVPISHRGLADYLEFARTSYCVPGEPPVVALHSKLIFDLTITSAFLSFVSGGRVVVFDGDPIVALGRIATDDRITFLKATPSQLEILARMIETPRALSTVVVGGEAFRRPVAVATAAACRPGVRIFNEYGPTEAVVGCMIHEWSPEVDVGTEVPIGAAAPGCELTVLDADGHVTPAGAWGELYVRRRGMATGYLNRPDLTAERFVTLHDVPGALGGADRGPWYRTGDRVRLERPGVLTYGGRLDDQLKVNGVRLEPAEVEAALIRHPRIDSALVRVWTPADRSSSQRCGRCGLGDDVPDVTIDEDGVCSTCRSFEAVAPQTQAWFRDEADLDAELQRARSRSTGDYDCLHLLSGGKDSSYALYQLVERGWRVHALTLDNGFISEGAKENIRTSVEALGITHEFATTADPGVMNEIFRDSLDRYSNVCQGCYKTIYTMAVARADALGIPVVVTGLSRGQFFETRLIPAQFEAGRFDPDAIDSTVLAARKVYHQVPDAVTELLPEQRVFDDGSVFDRVEFVDFYRYVDVDMTELYRYLEENAPWVRPADTGRSTNCLINVAGIQVHQAERGYHSYAEPYAWDVRLGHKTRTEALGELDDRLADGVDDASVAPMLGEVGYRAKRVEILTAWYTTADGEDIDPDELRRHVRDLVAESAVPAAFVRIEEMPLAASAKADTAALPAPTRIHRRADAVVLASTQVERLLADAWAEVLHIEQVGVTDDFFDLGGDSLGALEVVAAVADTMGVALDDAAVFEARTIRELAVLVEADPIGGGAVSTSQIPALVAGSPPPLSAGEEAMLFEYRRDPADTRYNVTRWYRLPADTDLARLETAIREVAMMHGPLSRSFDATRLRLSADHAVQFEHRPSTTIEGFRAFALRQREVPFDLDRGPLVRVHAAATPGPTGDATLSVLIGMHHISTDAGAFDVFWNQVARRYDLDDSGPDDSGPDHSGREASDLEYAAHGEWQRHEVHAAHREFWLDERRRADAAGPPASLGLASPAIAEADGYLSRSLDLTTAALRRGAARTPFVSALAAAGVTIARYSGRGADASVELGITASVKDHPSAAPLVGYFLNTLPVRIDLGAASTTRALVEQVGATVADAVEHRTSPFASIVRDARADGVAAPDVSVMLAYERLAPAALGGHVVEHEILASGTAVADVTLFVQERADDLRLGIEYAGRVVSASDAQRVLDTFASTLEEMTQQPDTTLEAMVVPHGPDDVVSELVGPTLGDTPRSVLHEIVRRFELEPDTPAVVDSSGRTLGTAQLLAAALDTAEAIEASVGGSVAGHLVGVCVDRSVDVVVAILAVQIAGAGFVPLDPAAPGQRVAAIVESVALSAVVTDERNEGRIEDIRSIRVTSDPSADCDVASLADRARSRIDVVGPATTAYVIFTSGSTGRPRGVAVSHANLAASTFARAHTYVEAPDRFMLTSSIGFDSSIVGLFWPLSCGGTIVIPTDDDVHDVDRLASIVQRYEVTHLLMVPSLYRALLARHPERLASLRAAIVAGETCSIDVVESHRAVFDALPDRRSADEDGRATALFNEYGPTEATVWSSVHRIDIDHSPTVSIGGPIAGVTLRVGDAAGRATLVGVAGELLVSGPTVTAGYLDDDEATSARFVDLHDTRWYRTGDLVRVVERSTRPVLEFLGRIDDQLNVGGVRIEPGEIEAALIATGEVTEAVVVAVRDGRRERLVAHVTATGRVTPGTPSDGAALRSTLASVLPASHVPSRIVSHASLPRTSHGKLDRSAVQALGFDDPSVAPTPATSALVDDIVSIWQRALGSADVTASTDYFEAGGDSLAAVEIVAAIEDTIGRQLTIGLLLDGRTPTGMAHLIDPSGDVAAGRPASLLRSEPGSSVDGVRLVTMQAGSPGSPMVVLTPAWDDLFGYRALVDALPDDIRVVAATVADTDPERMVTTIDALAAQFERALVELAADDLDRATVLLGWSTAGVVAFDLAERLCEREVDVRHIAMIDTYFPGTDQSMWSKRWEKYRSLASPGAIADEVSATARRRSKSLAKSVGTKLLTYSGTPVPNAPKRSSVGGVPLEALGYRPITGRTSVVMYAASATNPRRTFRAWTEVAEVDVVVVEGRHRGYRSIMAADRVGSIADDLTRRLHN